MSDRGSADRSWMDEIRVELRPGHRCHDSRKRDDWKDDVAEKEDLVDEQKAMAITPGNIALMGGTGFTSALAANAAYDALRSRAEAQRQSSMSSGPDSSALKKRRKVKLTPDKVSD